MLRRPRFLTVLRIDSVTRVLFLLLLVSLLMVADGYVLILLSRILGIYLLLAAEAATGLIAVVTILTSYRHAIVRVRESVRDGKYPEAEFRSVSCLWVGAVLLIVPGFVTDLIGVAVLIPPVRWLAGFWLARVAREGFEEIYEYLKLEE